MKKKTNLIWGILLVVTGILIAFNTLNLISINVFFDGWWTLFIIIPSFIGFWNDDDKLGSLISLIIGIALLLGVRDIIEFRILSKLILPFILIVIGLSFVINDIKNNKVVEEMPKSTKDYKYHFASFSGQTIDYDNENFSGCEINAIFGGIKCDLREAKIKNKAVINSTSIFGGVNILVPDNVKIKVVVTPIFGNVRNKHKKTNDKDAITIYINATCLFGGVKIK